MSTAEPKSPKKFLHGPWQTRFWNYTNTDVEGDECWEWMGSVNSDGYGDLKIEGRAKKAHRLSYELAYGEVPRGKKVCHTCDNRKCVRPDHLFVGTDADNHADRNAKGRQAKGEKHGRAKLTEDDVVEIKMRLAAGESRGQIARDFGVDTAAVRFIDVGEHWKHVQLV